MRLFVCDYTATTAAGAGRDALLQSLQSSCSGLTACDFSDADLNTWIGAVPEMETQRLPLKLEHWDCRNNRLAELGLQQDNFMDSVERLKSVYKPERIGVFLGTSTAGVGATEQAYREIENGSLPEHYNYEHTQAYFSLCGYVAERLGISGPRIAVSTACSSSAKVFGTAARFIDAGYCDAAIVGGVDSLCLTTLYGFNSLQLISSEPCRPCDQHRDGLSIGEAAGFALVAAEALDANNLAVTGWGESSDAYHMSAPDPTGTGAETAMRDALEMAGVSASDIDGVNLHGTGTPTNDVAECQAVERVFGAQTPVASTKGWTGHTLGAAGIIEAIICLLNIEHDFLAQNLNVEDVDEAIHVNVLRANQAQSVNRMLSNSFGFGGSNCSLVLERVS